MASVYRTMVEAIRRNNADLPEAEIKRLCRHSCPAAAGSPEARAWSRAVTEEFKPKAAAKAIEEPERCPRTIDMFEV
jgi:histone H3/H4